MQITIPDESLLDYYESIEKSLDGQEIHRLDLKHYRLLTIEFTVRKRPWITALDSDNQKTHLHSCDTLSEALICQGILHKWGARFAYPDEAVK